MIEFHWYLFIIISNAINNNKKLSYFYAALHFSQFFSILFMLPICIKASKFIWLISHFYSLIVILKNILISLLISFCLIFALPTKLYEIVCLNCDFSRQYMFWCQENRQILYYFSFCLRLLCVCVVVCDRLKNWNTA